MRIFAVLHVSHPERIEVAIRHEFSNDHLQLRDGEWLIAANLLTSRDICDRLAISDGTNGNGIVVAMDAYWGRASNNIWEWMTARKEAHHGE